MGGGRSARRSRSTPSRPSATTWSGSTNSGMSASATRIWRGCLATTPAGGSWPNPTTPTAATVPSWSGRRWRMTIRAARPTGRAATADRRPAMSANPQPAPEPSIVDAGVQAADAWLRRFQAAVVGSMAVVAAGVGAVAFFTSFEAITSYAKVSGGIATEHAWAVPLLVDSFIVMATGADLWLSAARSRRWWETCWPKLLLAGAAAVSFVLNVAHAGAGKWSARGVAAIPPAALVLSVELLVLIVRRAAMARSARLAAAAAAATSTGEATTEVVRGDQPTATVVAATGDRPALEATTATTTRASR